jgi:hypothetical protein
MFNVSIREYFSVLNVFIVCIRNTAVFKLIPVLCTHVYSYMFSTVHPPSLETFLSKTFWEKKKTKTCQLDLISLKSQMMQLLQH